MKHFTLLFTLLFLCLALSARTVYITRHGHRGDKNYYDKAVREQKLTPLGVEQATLLAHYLVDKCHFNGTIVVSPFYRTIETGAPTAKLLNKKMILDPGIQEMAPGKKPARGMSYAEIEARFPGQTVKGSTFTEPWTLCNEDTAARRERCAKALARNLAEHQGDLLLVTHGAGVGDLMRGINAKLPKAKQVKAMAWNCCLFIVEFDDANNPVSVRYTTEYMPDEKVTNNFKCPKIERPDDPRFMTKAQEKEAAAKKKAKKAKK